MTRRIIVDPPPTTGVEQGAIWLTRAGWYVLLMAEIEGTSVWNIAMWPEAEGLDVIPGPSAQASMLGDDALAHGGRLVQAATPEMLEAVRSASREEASR